MGCNKNPVKSKKLANLILKFDEVLGFNLKNIKRRNCITTRNTRISK